VYNLRNAGWSTNSKLYKKKIDNGIGKNYDHRRNWARVYRLVCNRRQAFLTGARKAASNSARPKRVHQPQVGCSKRSIFRFKLFHRHRRGVGGTIRRANATPCDGAAGFLFTSWMEERDLISGHCGGAKKKARVSCGGWGSLHSHRGLFVLVVVWGAVIQTQYNKKRFPGASIVMGVFEAVATSQALAKEMGGCANTRPRCCQWTAR